MQGTINPNVATESQGRQATGIAVEMSRLGIRMFGVGGVSVGIAPKLGATEWKVQAGHSSNSTTVTFPHPFLVCVLAIVLGGQDAAGTDYVVSRSLTGFVCSGLYFDWIAIGC